MRTNSVMGSCCLFVLSVLVVCNGSISADDSPAAEKINDESRKLDDRCNCGIIECT